VRERKERKRQKENIETGSQGKRRTGTDRQIERDRQIKQITAVIERNKEKDSQRWCDIHKLYTINCSNCEVFQNIT
jgi:hypothetical protein